MSTTWTDILTAELDGEEFAAVTYQLTTWGSGEFAADDLATEFDCELSEVRGALASMPRSDSYARESLVRIETALAHIVRTLDTRDYPESLRIR